MGKNKLQQASDKLFKKADYKYSPVAVKYKTYAAFAGYIVKIIRENKPSIWFVVNMDLETQSIRNIKRFCLY